MSQYSALNIKHVLLFLVMLSKGLCRETQCSKFHYEERLLEKMIRQEIKVEQMETEIKNALQSISTFMADMELKLNTKTSDMDSEIKEGLNKVSTVTDNMKQTLETHIDDLKETKNELQLLDNVAVPRIAFSAYHLKDVSGVAAGNEFVFTIVEINDGNGYNSQTGVFTAPQAGLYYFTVHMCNSINKFVVYSIIVDGKKVAISVSEDADDYTCNSVSTLTVLQTGSTVSVQSTSSGTAYQTDAHYRPSFNGVLLHK